MDMPKTWSHWLRTFIQTGLAKPIQFLASSGANGVFVDL